jgi:hypothetical protein
LSPLIQAVGVLFIALTPRRFAVVPLVTGTQVWAVIVKQKMLSRASKLPMA